MPRRFKDSPVLVQQHQIAVPPHDFQHQPAQDVVAQFIHRVNIDVNHAVAVHLLNAQNAPAENLLAQEHTEHRRFERIREIQIREVAARIVRRRAQQQPMIRRSRANQQHNGILSGCVMRSILPPGRIAFISRVANPSVKPSIGIR